ncbi:hypothetical protein OS493_012548 [Desmophyllum pertusum]|uniref:Uncharacterized protein n=1 Tax=Desmophyllum pertusum TaxID=174260 RepID=A0A9W9ZDN7_9CNID|nr:hypothetical protein OS493_012548 [Desmophyllum pertusum]
MDPTFVKGYTEKAASCLRSRDSQMLRRPMTKLWNVILETRFRKKKATINNRLLQKNRFWDKEAQKGKRACYTSAAERQRTLKKSGDELMLIQKYRTFLRTLL